MSSNRSTAWIKFVILMVMLAAFAAMKYYQHKEKPIPSVPKTETKSQSNTSHQNSGKANTSVPQKVYEIFQYIRLNKDAPNSYVGGRVFTNREKRLPLSDQNSKKIKYQEWDVNPKVKGQYRGAERLITGSDSSAYYTSDHYKTFTKIN